MESRPNAPRPPEFLISRLVVLLFILGLLAASFYIGHTLRLPFGLWKSDPVICELPPPTPPTPPTRAAVAQPETFVVVEQMPGLIGGLASVQRRVRYPEAAREAGIQGRVIVQFIVDEHGRVTDPHVMRGIGGGCDEEAVNAIRQARFSPGRQRGEAVSVKMSLPITFKLPRQS